MARWSCFRNFLNCCRLKMGLNSCNRTRAFVTAFYVDCCRSCLDYRLASDKISKTKRKWDVTSTIYLTIQVFTVHYLMEYKFIIYALRTVINYEILNKCLCIGQNYYTSMGKFRLTYQISKSQTPRILCCIISGLILQNNAFINYCTLKV